MEEWLRSFKVDLEQKGASRHTVRGYVTDVQEFARFMEERTGQPFSPTDMTPPDVVDYRAYLLKVREMKPATINRRLAGLRRFSRWAESAGLVAHSLIGEVQNVKQQEPLAPRALSRSEAGKLVGILNRLRPSEHHLRDRAIILTLLHTGLRGEG